MEKLETLCTAGGNVKWYGHCGNQYDIPQVLIIKLSYDLAIPILGIFQKVLKKCTPKFLAVLFSVANMWKQPNRPSTDEWMRKMYTYNGILFNVEKEGNSAICYDMDKPWGH